MWHQDPVGTALPVACHSQNGNYKNGEWDLAGHRARLRETFGNTTSDEFVDVMLGKLVEALRPSPFDHLDEPTLNAGLALIDSIQPRSEMDALIAGAAADHEVTAAAK